MEPRLVIPGAQHSDQVHQGAIFTIGLHKSGKDTPDADKLDKADQRRLALRGIAHCVGDANDVEIVARVYAEVAEDKPPWQCHNFPFSERKASRS